MRLFMALIIVVAMLLSVAVYAKDYDLIGKGGNYQGFIRDDGSTITRYDRHNNSRDWYDRDTGSRFDHNNNFQGWATDGGDSDDDD